MTDAAAPGDNPGKFQDIIKRRLEKGQCYSMPYFGTREFPAQFRRCTELPPCPDELKGTRDLGWMLWDLDYSDPANITPKFFRASLVDGVMTVPPPNSREKVLPDANRLSLRTAKLTAPYRPQLYQRTRFRSVMW